MPGNIRHFFYICSVSKTRQTDKKIFISKNVTILDKGISVMISFLLFVAFAMTIFALKIKRKMGGFPYENHP